MTSTTNYIATIPAPGKGHNKGAIATLDRLHQQQVHWTKTLYKASNDGLIVLLGECIDAFTLIRNDPEARKNLTEALKRLKLESRDGTHYATRVVHYVFREKSKRVTRYATIVRAALDYGVDGLGFAKFVKDQGGLDAVARKAKVAGGVGMTSRQISDQAKAILNTTPALHVVPKAHVNLKASGNALDTFAVALVRYNTQTGAAEIVYGTDNAALTRRFLEVVGKGVIEAAAKAKSSAVVVTQRQASSVAIAGAVAASTAVPAKKTTAKAA
jgi:hypothetical protein